MSQELLELAATLRLRAESERLKPGTDGGCASYEEAICILRKTDDVLRLAHAVRHLGDVHHEMGKPDLAASCYDEALDLYRSHPAPPPLDLANAIRSQAVLKEEAGAVAEAIALWEEARDLYALTNVEQGVNEAGQSVARLEAQGQ